jgi:hypothetical protein
MNCQTNLKDLASLNRARIGLAAPTDDDLRQAVMGKPGPRISGLNLTKLT